MSKIFIKTRGTEHAYKFYNEHKADGKIFTVKHFEAEHVPEENKSLNQKFWSGLPYHRKACHAYTWYHLAFLWTQIIHSINQKI